MEPWWNLELRNVQAVWVAWIREMICSDWHKTAVGTLSYLHRLIVIGGQLKKVKPETTGAIHY